MSQRSNLYSCLKFLAKKTLFSFIFWNTIEYDSRTNDTGIPERLSCGNGRGSLTIRDKIAQEEICSSFSIRENSLSRETSSALESEHLCNCQEVFGKLQDQLTQYSNS